MGIEKLEAPTLDKIEEQGPQRVHQRFVITHPYLANLAFSEKCFGTIRDISYSGLAVLVNATQSLPSEGNHITAKLSILGRTITCQLKLRHQSSNAIGLEFIHTTSEVLIFLRQYLEPLRMGRQFTLDKHSQPSEKMYCDELRNSVQIQSDNSGAITNAKLTIALHGVIHEVDVTPERTQISSAVTKLGEAPIARLHANGDPQIIASSIFILLGISSQEPDRLFSELIAILLRQCHVIPYQDINIVG